MDKIFGKRIKLPQLNLKNQIISSVLIFCYLIQLSLINLGCYSYNAIKNGNNKNFEFPKSNEILKFILKDQSEIEAYSKNCFLVEQKSNLIYCKGLVYDSNEVSPSDFQGFILADQIDSTRYFASGSIPHWLYWLNNDKMLRVDVLNVCDLRKINASQAWFIIDRNNTYRVIYFDEINQIQTPKINWLSTIIVLGIVVIISFVGAGASRVGNINMGGF